MFWNATTCQKRQIFAGTGIKNDNMAPVSDADLLSKLAQGPFFFFAFQAKPGGRMTQKNDTTTERKLWFSGAWGRSLPTSFCRSY